MPGVVTDWQDGGRGWTGKLLEDPQLQTLSPESQAAIQKYASSTLPGQQQIDAFKKAMATDPAFAHAMQEAKEKGALDHPITGLTKALMVAIAAVGTAGVASAAMGGAGAVGASSSAPALASGVPTAIGGASAIPTVGVPALEAGMSTAIGGSSALPSVASGARPTSMLGKLKDFATSDTATDMIGNAARSASDANANRDKQLPGMAATQLAQDRFALDAPGTRMSQSARAAMMSNMTPSKTSWAGPGSGQRGIVPSMSGGPGADMPNVSAAVKPLATEVMRKNLQDQLAGRDSQNKYFDQFGKSSVGDKMLGWASTGMGVVNGLKKAKVF